MRIAYIIEKLSGKGGMERIVTDKMNYLAEHTAHEVVLMLLWHDDKPLAYPLSPKIDVKRLNAPYGIPVIGFPLVWWRFRSNIHTINPDITIYTWVAGAFLACYGGWNGKSIFENHHTFSDMRHNSLVARAARKVDCVVALTENDVEAFREARRVEVIPNFTTIKEISADCSSRHCLAIGRFVDVKNYPRMLRMWKEISSKHTDWILDIVGEGPEEVKIRDIIAREGLQDTVVVHPATNSVTDYYLQSSIYLMTSKSEGLPMVLIEAQSCGLPIVAFDCDCGPRMVITDGKDGYLIPYDDDKAFTDRLSSLMDSESLRHIMGLSAKESARRFHSSSVMPQWLQLFTSL